MNRRYMKLGAGIAVAALLGAACGDDESEPDVAAADEQPSESGETTTTMEHEGMGASHAGVETGAAELRAGLTSLLQEHVYLAGAAISTAVQAGGDLEAPAVVSAVDTLDAHSAAPSAALSSVYEIGRAPGRERASP